MGENRPIRFGHVKRMENDEIANKISEIKMKGNRKKVKVNEKVGRDH